MLNAASLRADTYVPWHIGARFSRMSYGTGTPLAKARNRHETGCGNATEQWQRIAGFARMLPEKFMRSFLPPGPSLVANIVS